MCIHHHFSEQPEDTTVGQGTTALLRCHLSDSNPPAVYRWKKDGHPISPDNDRVVLSLSGYLYIRNVTDTDEGEYQCLAENEVSGKTRWSRVSSLSVNEMLDMWSGESEGGIYLCLPLLPPPRLIALPETTVTVSEGGRVVLECATDGATATISWSHTSLVSLPHNSYTKLRV
ncbi:Immunoglobulin superfamily DCC subclass member 4 [Geodia barretti]|uniref:Immunoglobulin superfamily DCC subclass member 4 n=1 Tax=Geodia barretti TaxID=519541 RepID=A0AA35SXW7_GEOBA|nr:Immunoglobulin superfamily DCC subclass member 4 [Geodia barretti]